MDNADYLDVAVRLANAALTDVSALQEALHEEPWWATRVTSEDLIALRPVAEGLRTAFAAAVADDTPGVRVAVNALLEAYPLRPRLSAGHDAEPNWHIHVADPDEPPATEVAAAAAWGVAHGVVRYGLSRWGQCADANCENYFLDTSTNRAKRYCSPRCANRVHVAAHRSRQRSTGSRASLTDLEQNALR
ncbi:CGNR zinc finger domain-containing protein [Kibdelosporangium aridum]|uniref:CGNR zinc finger domain-containing protein n=1 Tax=Kibdelosporangium aridum TaxID=2030 RepID=A0A428YJJ5_KIBAR|nr:CGNR zinc finger domain-containing protein [Kibdelosporangium aridum]RSM67740.1 CGNR zinc finger domain-containing protein [Kibdelosporangium aridum]